jgi:hypothetical protein
MKNTFTFTEGEIRVLLRGLTFALDMGEENYFAFYPDADDYSDGDQELDEAARVVAQSLRERLGSTEPISDPAEDELLAACKYAVQFSDADINPTIRKRLQAALNKVR